MTIKFESRVTDKIDIRPTIVPIIVWDYHSSRHSSKKRTTFV